MEKLKIYESSRVVPREALKAIAAGRLKGKSDINPMWRIKKLTELFGPCGIGWKYEILDERLEAAPNGEIAAFVKINLFYVDPVSGEWSCGIPGTGGSSFVANERNGPYVSDECFKMALTDAVSVACKALGFGANVYWDSDKTKYGSEKPNNTPPPAQTQPEQKLRLSEEKITSIMTSAADKEIDIKVIEEYSIKNFGTKQFHELNVEQYTKIMKKLEASA